MNKLLFTAVVLAILVSAKAVDAQAKFSKVVLRPALWEKMIFKPKAECGQGTQDCARRFLEQAEVNLGQKPIFEFFELGEIQGRSLTIVFVTLKVDEDDSLTGIRYRLALSLGDVEDKTYKLENLGRQFTCARGHKFWSKKRCP